MSDDDQPLSPDLLLRKAAQGDAARAAELLAYVSPTKLLDAVLTQADLAIEEGRHRPAGIDAIAELDRAAIEVMDLPQGADLDLDLGEVELDLTALPDDEDAAIARLLDQPVLIGWELVTLEPAQLATATVTLAVRPWQLALVAFIEEYDAQATPCRRVVSAAADGRLVGAVLRYTTPDDDPDVLGATVTRDPADLGADADLAASLRAALEAAARGN